MKMKMAFAVKMMHGSCLASEPHTFVQKIESQTCRDQNRGLDRQGHPMSLLASQIRCLCLSAKTLPSPTRAERLCRARQCQSKACFDSDLRTCQSKSADHRSPCACAKSQTVEPAQRNARCGEPLRDKLLSSSIGPAVRFLWGTGETSTRQDSKTSPN